MASLLDLHGLGAEELTPERWAEWLDRAAETQQRIAERTFESRAKDYANPFKAVTFSSDAEMSAVMGRAEENSFVRQVREESAAFARRADALKEVTA